MARPPLRIGRLLAALSVVVTAAPAEADGLIRLVVDAGRPLQVRLDRRVTIRTVGQPVTATIVEPVYAYDRVVIPAGTLVRGHVAKLVPRRRLVRLVAMLSGDFTPGYAVSLQFDSLVLGDDSVRAIATAATTAGAPLVMSGVPAERRGIGRRAKEVVEREARRRIGAVTRRGRMQRLGEVALAQLPYHPQYLHAGTVYDATLTAPIDFGTAPTSELAEPGSAPAPDTIVDARLVTAMTSAGSRRGAPVGAVLTRPVFTADHRLIFPEGVALDGQVTVARAARYFHRNGTLRFLIDRVRPLDAAPRPFLASLYSVETPTADAVTLDDEGGATVRSSRKRFIAPAVAAFVIGSAFDRGDAAQEHAGEAGGIEYGSVAGKGVSGFIGGGLVGAAISQASRPAAMAYGAWGTARTVYRNVIGKGREIAFPENTRLRLQLASEPRPR